MTVGNLRALQESHEQTISDLQAAHSRIQAQLAEPEQARGAHRELQAQLAQVTGSLADNRRQLVEVQNSLAIALDAAVEGREVRVSDAERRLDVARTNLRDAGGSAAHRERLSEAAARADDVLVDARIMLARQQAELSALSLE